MKTIFYILSVVLICSVLLSMLHTHGNFILVEYLVYYLWLIPPLLAVEAVRSRCLFKSRQAKTEDNVNLSSGSIDRINIIAGIILFIFLLLALVSSLNHLTWFYFIEWRYAPVPGFNYFNAGFIRFLFLTQLLTLYFIFFRKKISSISLLVLLCFQLLCLGAFLLKTRGVALYGDDHPCFIYRVWEFIKTFPKFLNYNPQWNAGVYDYSVVETGTISLGILFWPLWKLFNIASIYTYVYAVSFIILIPLLYVFSLKIIGGDWVSAWIAGLLSMGVSQYYFLWLFQYGTTGALLSSAFLVPFAACIFRVIWLDKREWWLAAILVLSGFFLVMWPPNLLIGIAVLFSLIFSISKWSKRKILFLVLCFMAFIILYFKIFAVIARPSVLRDISYTVNYSGKRNLNFIALIEGWHYLKGGIMQGHPLLIFFGIGGIFFLTRRDVKYWFLPILVSLIILSGWGQEIDPEIQLPRMGIPLFFVAVVPASLWISQLLSIKNIRFAVVQAGLGSLLILGGWNCVKMYNNDGFANYRTMPRDIQGLICWIKENTPINGRIFLAGGTIHGYGGGHAVILPYLTQREMLANDYVQFSTKGRVPKMPPKEFMGNKEKLFQYMELYNITYLITQYDEWKNIFRAYPDQYIEETTIGDKTVFRVNRKSTMFLQGDGTINSDFNLLEVYIDNPDEDIVIKYNWLDGLSVQAPSQIFPFDTGHGIKFIGIHPNGSKNISIKYKRFL